jgi:hypothetical protein
VSALSAEWQAKRRNGRRECGKILRYYIYKDQFLPIIIFTKLIERAAGILNNLQISMVILLYTS